MGPANAAPAGPATTALAPFPTDEHKAARYILGNMFTANTNKEVGLPPWTVSKKFKSFEYKEIK